MFLPGRISFSRLMFLLKSILLPHCLMSGSSSFLVLVLIWRMFQRTLSPSLSSYHMKNIKKTGSCLDRKVIKVAWKRLHQVFAEENYVFHPQESGSHGEVGWRAGSQDGLCIQLWRCIGHNLVILIVYSIIINCIRLYFMSFLDMFSI